MHWQHRGEALYLFPFMSLIMWILYVFPCVSLLLFIHFCIYFLKPDEVLPFTLSFCLSFLFFYFSFIFIFILFFSSFFLPILPLSCKVHCVRIPVSLTNVRSAIVFYYSEQCSFSILNYSISIPLWHPELCQFPCPLQVLVFRL